MTSSERVLGSDYIYWAKTSASSRFNLTNSGMPSLKFKDLDLRIDDLELSDDSGYGYPPLVKALAVRLDVDPESLVTGAGATFANHLAMASLVAPGDEVLIEQPTYGPLLSLARYLGAEVKRFPRSFEEQFQVIPEALERCISPRTRLIVITNLHNPSSVLLDAQTLSRIGDLARSVKARVLIDEVYLEALFARRPRTAYHLGPEFVVTSSLTKAFGLSGLRCGWIVADTELAQKMWLLKDLFVATDAHAVERLALAALRQLDEIGSNAERVLEANRRLAVQFLGSRDDLQIVSSEYGTIMFPGFKTGSADDFCDVLKKRYETSVVPGRFFEMPAHFRIGLGGDFSTLREGLGRLAAALDEYGNR
jgi:aspartate/methionine/tyrosine aminotransferase